jgi:hypothetical protein
MANKIISYSLYRQLTIRTQFLVMIFNFRNLREKGDRPMSVKTYKALPIKDI